MRPSVAPGRSTTSSSANAKLREKKKEFQAVAALERASAVFAERIEELCHDGEIMANAGMVHGKVLSQWGDMFDILDFFLSTRDAKPEGTEEGEAPSTASGVQLVRIPLEELQGSQVTGERPER
ncbi:hypothetical protein NEOLEDRAFT_1068021 [Neolentinus lepideus HHB14362 ss-1]|uniref:DASH complex subunit DAD2 n=1 Tax=Neolentinus lepideus HHB14362 ss-1 TaxID=1314782 RepID=A0A165RTY8_9AGAM|nr:hypothetical protein NEOLEDRAFT_1068021 [Neolentinus lepideus HHB14362 ss-1]